MWEQVGASKPWTPAPLSRLTEGWDLALAKESVITIARVDPRFADRVVTSRRSRRILVVDDEPGPMIEAERDLIRRALRRYDNDKDRAARALGMSRRRTLYRRVKDHGLDK
jgi:DNA-binding NtrC family response regulator